MGKQKRLRKERAEKKEFEEAFETPRRPKWYYTVYRLMLVFVGCLALTIIGACLTSEMLPNTKSVWPGLLTIASWFFWILYVFKFMKIKD